MFQFRHRQDYYLTCCIDEKGYSLSALKNNKKLVFSVQRSFPDKTSALFATTLAQDVSDMNLIGHPCQVVFTPKFYSLVLMDAIDVPEEEMAKALRWRLKGLIDYPLNDIATDAFLIPPYGVNSSIRKVFVAVTPLSALMATLESFKTSFLRVTSVSIAELAIKNLVSLVFKDEEFPLIIINLNENYNQIHIVYKNKLYMIRDLSAGIRTQDNTLNIEALQLEIQRSIDYSISELKLPQPRQLVFTPGVQNSEELLQVLEQDLGKKVYFMDLNHCLEMERPMGLEEQSGLLLSICGSIAPSLTEEPA